MVPLRRFSRVWGGSVNISTSSAPSFGNGMDTSFILGIAKTGKDVKILLDVDRVLTREEVGVLSEIQ